jgi:hypothetical protein
LPRRPVILLLHAEAAIQRYGYAYDFDAADPNAIGFKLVTQFGTYLSQLIVSPKEALVRHFVLIEEEADEPAQARCQVELAHRVSRQLAIGCLTGDWDSGAVWYRNGWSMEGQESPTDAIDQMLCCSGFALNLYRTAKRFVMSGASLSQAVEASLIVLDAA